MIPCMRWGWYLLLLVPLAQANGQSAFDRHLLEAVYAVEQPAVTQTLRTVNHTFFPTVIVLPLVHWGWAGTGDLGGHAADYEAAYRLTVTEVSTLAASLGLKYMVRRARPYHQLDLASRVPKLQPGDEYDPYAFPSGHAALAFAVATSLTLSYPEWYVAVPLYIWAVAASTARMWLGVHYPTDVLAGAALGTAIAWGVHQMRDRITPQVLRSEKEAPPMLIHLRFSL